MKWREGRREGEVRKCEEEKHKVRAGGRESKADFFSLTEKNEN